MIVEPLPEYLRPKPGVTPNVETTNSIRRELERRPHDEIRVWNPLSEDYLLKYDGYLERIPAKDKDLGHGQGQYVLPRYKAEKFVKEVIALLKQRFVQKAIKSENTRRVEKGFSQMTNYEYGEQDLFTTRLLAEHPNFDEQWMRAMWIRVEREYGMEILPQRELAQPTEKSFEEKLGELDNLDQPEELELERFEVRVSAISDTTKPQENIPAANTPQDLVQEFLPPQEKQVAPRKRHRSAPEMIEHNKEQIIREASESVS